MKRVAWEGAARRQKLPEARMAKALALTTRLRTYTFPFSNEQATCTLDAVHNTIVARVVGVCFTCCPSWRACVVARKHLLETRLQHCMQELLLGRKQREFVDDSRVARLCRQVKGPSFVMLKQCWQADICSSKHARHDEAHAICMKFHYAKPIRRLFWHHLLQCLVNSPHCVALLARVALLVVKPLALVLASQGRKGPLFVLLAPPTQ